MENSIQSKLELKPDVPVCLGVSVDQTSVRLDQFLTLSLDGLSRTFFQKLIYAGCITINGVVIVKPSVLLKPSDVIMITLPGPSPKEALDERARCLDVHVIYEHPSFLVISKPAGLVVHQPHTQSTAITLVDWLTLYYQELAAIGQPNRPGIVHRLDKDTSGLLIVARTPQAHAQLSSLFKDRAVSKTYLALAEGRAPACGRIDFTIDRHPTQPTKMTHRINGGRDAYTNFKVKEYFKNHSLIELTPVTGRTHQLRVHCAAIGHPLLGDMVYGNASPLIARQALHAYSLAFEFDGKPYQFTQEPPMDFSKAVEALRKDPIL